MKMKEIKIRWVSTDPATDMDFSSELTFDSSSTEDGAAYMEAIATMKTCLIASGAYYETEQTTEEK